MLGPAARHLFTHRRRLARGMRWCAARLRRILVDRRERPHGADTRSGARSIGDRMSQSRLPAFIEGVSRDIVFTDYAVRVDSRHTVTIATRLDGTPRRFSNRALLGLNTSLTRPVKYSSGKSAEKWQRCTGAAGLSSPSGCTVQSWCASWSAASAAYRACLASTVPIW